MIKTNFHTHTFYCDGKNSPEEIILAALEKGFTSLGFSSHCDMYVPSVDDYSMTEEKELIYRKEIFKLKEKYKEKIKIFCGVELDYYSRLPKNAKYEYLIGSAHYVLKENKYIPMDLSSGELQKAVDELYGGDFDSLAEDYFDTVSKIPEKIDCAFIGHIDLISKYFEITGRTESERYLAAAQKAVEKLIPYGKPFEINTGAISRGYRTTPYPSPKILKMIKDMGGKIIFSSDCHDKNYLDCFFNEALDLAKSIGFSEQAILTENGIRYIPI